MGGGRIVRALAGILALTPILLSASAADASALTEVRLLHAVPGAPRAELELRSDRVPPVTLAPVGFGGATDYGEVPTGAVQLALSAGDQRVARSSERLEDGRYTVVAVPDGERARLVVHRDGEAVAGRARWRMVHAATEIEGGRVTIDGRAAGRLERGEALDYRPAAPGPHSFALRRPRGGEPLVDLRGAELVAGTAQTVYAIGSGGEPTRLLVVEDDVATPSAAPATGLGGLAREDGGAPWLVALLAALAAGTLGGVVHARRGHGSA